VSSGIHSILRDGLTMHQRFIKQFEWSIVGQARSIWRVSAIHRLFRHFVILFLLPFVLSCVVCQVLFYIYGNESLSLVRLLVDGWKELLSVTSLLIAMAAIQVFWPIHVLVDEKAIHIMQIWSSSYRWCEITNAWIVRDRNDVVSLKIQQLARLPRRSSIVSIPFGPGVDQDVFQNWLANRIAVKTPCSQAGQALPDGPLESPNTEKSSGEA
jgi:hypothetical protein